MPAPLRDPGSITALGYEDGAVFVSRVNDVGCVIEKYREGQEANIVVKLDSCPTRMMAGDGSLRLVTPSGEILFSGDATPGAGLPAIVSRQNYVTRSENHLAWHRDGTSATAKGSWTGPVVILDKEDAVVAARREPDGERLIRLEWPSMGDKLTERVLTDPFERIGAVEPDDDQKEMALSVLRNGSFDIAITNAEEKLTNFVPEDPGE